MAKQRHHILTIISILQNAPPKNIFCPEKKQGPEEAKT